MMDKKSEKLNQDLQKKEDLIARLTRELAEAKKQKSAKARAYHTHQVCEMGGTTKKYLIDPDLLTKEDLEELLEFAFSKDDVQNMLKEKLRAHGWQEDAEKPVESKHENHAEKYGDRSASVQRSMFDYADSEDSEEG